VQCPKCKNTQLQGSTLSSHLAVESCDECKGTWIPAENYADWQSRQPLRPHNQPYALESLAVDFVQSPYDTKGALCPECRRYLARAKVMLANPFYVERCPNCQGVWCDHGEWDVLETLGLHTMIDQLFSAEWQTQIRQIQQMSKERQATIEKLGTELANLVFEVGEKLKEHPNGDFGVAYLMRQISES